ncbi:MAG: DUF896 domain-containing protein [Frisingicoccus sp.]
MRRNGIDYRKDIERINELYKKSKTPEGLTAEERREQADLRSAYLKSIRTNLKGQLDTIKIQKPGRNHCGFKEKTSGKVWKLSVLKEKKALREAMRQKRDSMMPEDIQNLSREIFERLRARYLPSRGSGDLFLCQLSKRSGYMGL